VYTNTPEEKAELLSKLDAQISVFAKQAGGQQDDKRGGHSINLIKFSPGQQQSNVEIQVLGAMAQRKESEILVLEKQNAELDKEHKKIRADFMAVLQSNSNLLQKKQRIR